MAQEYINGAGVNHVAFCFGYRGSSLASAAICWW